MTLAPSVPLAKRPWAELIVVGLLFLLASYLVSIIVKVFSSYSDSTAKELHLIVLTAYFTLMIFLILVNFVVGWSFKRSTYLYYAAFLFFHGLSTAYYEKWLTFWAGSSANWNDIFRITIPISIIALLLFTRNFLELKSRDKRLSGICRILLLLWTVLLGQVLFIKLPLALSIVTIVQAMLAPATGLFLVIAGVRAWMRGQIEARFFTIAFWIHLIGLTIFLIQGDYVESTASAGYYQLLLASAFEITLPSIALADLLRRSLKERNRAQAEAIENLKRAQKVEAEYSQRLERDVDERTRELANVNAHKDRLISILAHDLRSPLNSINQMCEYLLKTQDSNEAEDYIDALGGIHDSGKALYELLENLLCWAQWQGDESKIEPILVDAEHLADEALRLFRFQALRSAIELSLDLQYKKPILTEPQMVKVILRNLISNAIAHTPSGGEITLTCRRDDKRAEILFIVQDTGPGISQDALSSWKDTGQALPRDSDSTSGGLGLGLVLSRTLTEKLSGRLEVFSEINKGACFTLCLPD